MRQFPRVATDAQLQQRRNGRLRLQAQRHAPQTQKLGEAQGGGGGGAKRHPGGQRGVQGCEESREIRGGKRAVAVAVELTGELVVKLPRGYGVEDMDARGGELDVVRRQVRERRRLPCQVLVVAAWEWRCIPTSSLAAAASCSRDDRDAGRDEAVIGIRIPSIPLEEDPGAWEGWRADTEGLPRTLPAAPGRETRFLDWRAGWRNSVSAVKQEKANYLEQVQLLRAPQSVIVAIEVAEDTAENALVLWRQLLFRLVVERRRREGNRALSNVEDLTVVLSTAGAALDAALDVLLHYSRLHFPLNTSRVDARHARGDACSG